MKVLGVRIDCVDNARMLARVEQWIDQSNHSHSAQAICRQVCTINPEFVVDAQTNGAFAGALANADLCVPDGIGTLWAANLHGARLSERVTGSDGIYHLCQRAAMRDWSVFFLGAAPGVAKQTAVLLQARYPGLRVCGSESSNPTDEAWAEIHQQLAQSQPDLLFVAFGHPRQDLWIDAHRAELPVKVAMGVGGAFDFVSGVQQRAPQLWQQVGLEWLYRLLREPRRWRRMLKLPKFVGLVLWERLIGVRR